MNSRLSLIVCAAVALNLVCSVATGETRRTTDVVLIPLTIRGHVYDFLVDTGSEQTAIDLAAATESGFALGESTTIAGNYKAITGPLVEIDDLVVGPHKFHNLRAIAIDLKPVARALGTAVDGVLGTDLLEQFTFKLIYSQSAVVIAPLGKLGPLGTPLRLKRDHGQYFLSATLNSTPVELLLDTGTNSTNLSWRTWQALSRTWKPSDIPKGAVSSQDSNNPAFFLCLPRLTLANTTLIL